MIIIKSTVIPQQVLYGYLFAIHVLGYKHDNLNYHNLGQVTLYTCSIICSVFFQNSLMFEKGLTMFVIFKNT